MGCSSDGGDRPWQSYHTVYTNAKAGMDGIDKEKVQRIVYEMSKGSKYFESEKRKEAFIQQKIENLRAQCAKLTDEDISCFQAIADKKIIELEASRDLSKVWLHSDMDAFYAAVETLQNPTLIGKPVAVGSLSMICTASYEARKFGVRAAMPGFIARKLCPDLVFVPPKFERYTYYSELTRKVFRKYDPNFMATSLDEAYLNITETCNKRGISGEEVADELRKAIFEETGLTCSAGVAPNQMLAKVCSDINKPNGQFILPNDKKAVMTFISSLPVRKVGGIGKVTEHVLRDVFGINTCQEMLQKSALLCALFSQCSTDFFLSVGLGLGSTETPECKLRKSISTERTFSATGEETLLFEKLADIAETLAKDMQKEGLCGRTLTLKLKTMTFEVRTRAVSLPKYIHDKEEILSYASKLLKAELPLSLRLIGLRLSQFRDNHGPLDPMQKTLSSFIVSREDTSRRYTHVEKSADLPISNKQIMPEGEIKSSTADRSCFSNDDSYFNIPHELDILTESNQLMNSLDIGSGNDVDRINGVDSACPAKPRPSNPEKIVRIASSLETNFSENKSVASLINKPLWVEDYICSVCGFELPPSFIEERQEHLDYHLAQVLHEEGSSNNRTYIVQHERMPQKARKAVDSRKKLKPSPDAGRHIPIDAFFVRCNKNL